MATFLTWIGWYNLLGALLLFAMTRPAVADLVLRRLTEIGRAPHDAGPYGAVWIVWAATTNAFLGFVMVRASAWPEAVAREVTWGALAVYAVMEVGLTVAHLRGRMPLGRGVGVTHALWLGQLAWAAWALASA